MNVQIELTMTILFPEAAWKVTRTDLFRDWSLCCPCFPTQVSLCVHMSLMLAVSAMETLCGMATKLDL